MGDFGIDEQSAAITKHLWQEYIDLAHRELPRALWLSQVVPRQHHLENEFDMRFERLKFGLIEINFDYEVFNFTRTKYM